MRTETRYICELCGYRYNTEEECHKCEESHNAATELVYQKFDHKFGESAKYPGSIIMKMANGHKAEYRFYKPVVEPASTTTNPSTPEPTEPTDPSDPNEPIFDPTNP